MCVVFTPGLPKSEGALQAPLLTLGGSSSEQASTSKQPLYGASGSRDDIFSLGGLCYLTSSKSCSSRSLGCVCTLRCGRPPTLFILLVFSIYFSPPFTHRPVPGLLCWTVSRRTQEPLIRLCWRDLLCNHSPLKVVRLKLVLLTVCRPQSCAQLA